MVKRHLHDENEEIPVVEAVGSRLPLKGTGALVSRAMPSGYDIGTRDEIADVVESWSGPARISGSSPVPVVRLSLSSGHVVQVCTLTQWLQNSGSPQESVTHHQNSKTALSLSVKDFCIVK